MLDELVTEGCSLIKISLETCQNFDLKVKLASHGPDLNACRTEQRLD